MTSATHSYSEGTGPASTNGITRTRSTAPAMSSDALVSPTPFSFAGRTFVCAARRNATGMYQPVVICQANDSQGGVTELPSDTEPYLTVAEALRHAEQQAVRWMHDRTGDGQGRF